MRLLILIVCINLTGLFML